MGTIVKQELPAAGNPPVRTPKPPSSSSSPLEVIDLSSSDSECEAMSPGKRQISPSGGKQGRGSPKRPKMEVAAALPPGFLDPLPLPEPVQVDRLPASSSTAVVAPRGCNQFWKAGDYEGGPAGNPASVLGVGMDHLRVHPKFLHSNATSHKWALGALAELLDNSLDEVCNGGTYVNIDMLVNRKDGSRVLLVEDNGGGMDPDKMRQCMSLGYSVKNKIANTIGQYGNGFKTSTMRLGADVIVFSRSPGKEGISPTQSIGMLSYTFLRNTGREDIVVPMLDYAKGGQVWNKMSRSSSLDWNTNLETIIQWSPYTSEADLLQQFGSMTHQGTRVIIYNLWEDDQGELELDFDADKHDIQVRGVNRDVKKIEMAERYPNSRHFLTYRHSLRSYASILYYRLPHVFRIILRGKEVEHHNIVTDMMFKQEVTYRPTGAADPNMVAEVKLGFVKDAKDHIDVQGFNVYHKNRLIKPFWRIWNPAGSAGRGVIGVLEADFIEPAHDKQGFERTNVLARLENRLVQMQKSYWSENCHKIGYARINKKKNESEDRESSPDSYSPPSRRSKKDQHSGSNYKTGKASTLPGDLKGGPVSSTMDSRTKSHRKFEGKKFKSHGMTDSSDESDNVMEYTPTVRLGHESRGSKASPVQKAFQKESSDQSLSTPPCSVNYETQENHVSDGGMGLDQTATLSQSKVGVACHRNESILTESEMNAKQLKDENEALKERIMKIKESMLQELQHERDKQKSLTDQLQEAQRKLEEANKEQEALMDIFSEERSRRNREEENLRKKLKDASVTIQDLLEKLSSGLYNKKPDQ